MNMDVVGQQNDAVEIPAAILKNVDLLSNIVSNFDSATLVALSHAYSSFTGHVLNNCNITKYQVPVTVTKYTLHPLTQNKCGSILFDVYGVDSSDDDIFQHTHLKQQDFIDMHHLRNEIVLRTVDVQGFNHTVLNTFLGFDVDTCSFLPFGRAKDNRIRSTYISREMGFLLANPQDDITAPFLQLVVETGADKQEHQVHINGILAGNETTTMSDGREVVVINMVDGQIVSLLKKKLLGYQLSIETEFLFKDEASKPVEIDVDDMMDVGVDMDIDNQDGDTPFASNQDKEDGNDDECFVCEEGGGKLLFYIYHIAPLIMTNYYFYSFVIS